MTRLNEMPANSDRPRWARRLAEARQRAKLSQKKLSETIGRGQSTVAQWESGVSEPNLATFAQLGAIFGVAPAWLAFGVGQPTEDDPLAFSILERRKHDKLFAFAFTEAARLFAEEGLHMDLAYLAAYALGVLSQAEGADDMMGAQQRIRAALDAERASTRAEMDEFRKKRLR